MELEPFSFLCVHQDTVSESQEMKIGVARPIFTHINIKGSMGQRYIHSKIWEENVVAILHLYGAKAISLILRDHQETESEFCEI